VSIPSAVEMAQSRIRNADSCRLRISQLETEIGAGLIEEVIQVAEGELKLVDEMTKAKA
jgi:hypothetical protein